MVLQLNVENQLKLQTTWAECFPSLEMAGEFLFVVFTFFGYKRWGIRHLAEPTVW